MSNTKRTLWLSAAAGALCGIRSMTLAAVLASKLHPRRRIKGTISRGLVSPVTVAMLPVLAAGEMMADKSPLLPNRIDLPPLIGRIGMAKLCAIVIAEQRREGIVVPAAVAASAAIAGAYASYHLRQLLTRRLRLPDPLVALAEDAIVLSSTTALADSAIPA